MKTNSMRGMRDVPSIQGLRHRSLPTTREQTIAEVARLEHEKARLERELALWLQHQERTEKQLWRVEGRLATLQGGLEPRVSQRPVGRGRDRGSRGERDDGDEGESRGWRELSMKY